MARLSRMPRVVLEAAWREGLHGKRIHIPPREEGGKRAAIVRDLLVRAERRVVETGDARNDAVRQAWGSDREEAARFGAAHSVVWRAAREAEAEIVRWWKDGERDRQWRLHAMGDAVAALAEYRRARREIRAGAAQVRGVRPEVLTMAIRSVDAAWWGRAGFTDGRELVLAEEAAFLAVLLADGRLGLASAARLAGSRTGLSTQGVADLVRRVEVGAGRAARAFAQVERHAA
ncbi:MAG: hypothetical protein U0166_00665 [Acidobacteriota bacterium]